MGMGWGDAGMSVLLYAPGTTSLRDLACAHTHTHIHTHFSALQLDAPRPGMVPFTATPTGAVATSCYSQLPTCTPCRSTSSAKPKAFCRAVLWPATFNSRSLGMTMTLSTFCGGGGGGSSVVGEICQG